MGVREEYFEWICYIVMDEKKERYQRLLWYLFNKPYRYTLWNDENREIDGVYLRYRFTREAQVMEEIGGRNPPCSMLEMMTALCIRCEENVMRSFDVGDRTSDWFYSMICTLGIAQTDDIFDEGFVDVAVERFLNRDFQPNGTGGLFYISNPFRDLRGVELWYQAMWWVDEQLNI